MIISLSSIFHKWLTDLFDDNMILYIYGLYIENERERESVGDRDNSSYSKCFRDLKLFSLCFSPKNRLWGFGWDVDSPMKGLTCWKGIKSCSFIVFPILGRTCPILGYCVRSIVKKLFTVLINVINYFYQIYHFYKPQ